VVIKHGSEKHRFLFAVQRSLEPRCEKERCYSLQLIESDIRFAFINHREKRYSMPSLQEKLRQVPWETLQHAYGSAKDTPTWLLALLSDQAERRDEALSELWASICHQGSVYEASCAAIPFLIEILAEVPDSRKADILSLLEGLAHGSWYANKNQRFLRMNRSLRNTHSRYEWFSWGEFFIAGNEFHEPQWIRQAHQLVSEGIESYLALLRSSETDVVRATLDLLAGFQEQKTLLIPNIAPLAFEEAETSLQIPALRCLGALLEQEAVYWQEYLRLTQASDISPEVRYVAAHALAWYHPSSASPAVVEILLTSVLPPQSCYELREVCKVLSHLGMPYGFQGLIDALKYGADHWSVLDTIRVAEALCDIAFFGGWVQNRFWRRNTGRLLSDLSSLFDGWDNKDQEANIRWGYSTGFGTGFGDFAISSFGYDDDATEQLEKLFAQEGLRALSENQRLAIEAVLRCEPLWQIKQDLLAIYGLPTTRRELEAFFAREA
jgi:hypothetical protein